MNKGIGDKDYYLKHYINRDIKQYSWLIDDIMPYYNGGKVLDLGCGIGLVLDLLIANNIDCIGIEGSFESFDLIKDYNKPIIYQDLKDKFPIKNSSINIVILNQVIEHLNKPTQINVINEAFRVLKPGGAFLIYSPSVYNIKERFADKTHINMLSPSKLEKMLFANGFKNVIDKNYPTLNLSNFNLKLHYLLIKISNFTGLRILPQTSNFIAIK